MAEFEGVKNLNRETHELEVKGKFKLSEDELDNVSGGCGERERKGFVPGEACPLCSGTLVGTDEIRDGVNHVSVCELCGEEYYWYYTDEKTS